MAKVNKAYELFKKQLSEETGEKDEVIIAMLMAKLKRAENTLHRLYEGKANTGHVNPLLIENQKLHVIFLLKKFKTIKLNLNADPRGHAIRLTFTKTEWINTIGSDVVIDW